MKRFSSLRSVRSSQRGMSLIEVMVAMLIGVILILGVTQIFLNNQKTYLFQQGQVGNQENGRFALALLAQELSSAGYRSNPVRPFPAGSGLGCVFPAGASVVALSATQLCIRYQAPNRTDTNCLGGTLANGDQSTIVTPYRQSNPIVIEKIVYDSNAKAITCTAGAATQELVTGVAAFNFDYGSGSQELKTVTSFSATPADTIGAVRYTALMVSPGTASIRDTTTPSAALTEWNNRFGTRLADTTQIYQLVQGTTMIRNQLQ